jgi:hypothetical protein
VCMHVDVMVRSFGLCCLGGVLRLLLWAWVCVLCSSQPEKGQPTLLVGV